MVVNSRRAYKPRSASTSTVQPAGTLPWRYPKRTAQWGHQAPGCVAVTIRQATGMAQHSGFIEIRAEDICILYRNVTVITQSTALQDRSTKTDVTYSLLVQCLATFRSPQPCRSPGRSRRAGSPSPGSRPGGAGLRLA